MKDWIEVTSSNLIDAYYYDKENHEFHVIFKTTGIGYVFFGVSEVTAEKIVFSTAGKDIKEYIIDGGFEYKKLD